VSTVTPLSPTPRSAQTGALSRFVTVKDVATALDVSLNHVYRMISAGQLPYLDVSLKGAKTRRPKIRIPADRVEAILAARLRTAPAATVASE
jgi:excisionase family DNA binding protein